MENRSDTREFNSKEINLGHLKKSRKWLENNTFTEKANKIEDCLLYFYTTGKDIDNIYICILNAKNCIY